MEEIRTRLLDRPQEAKERGWLGKLAPQIEANLAAAEQKLAAITSACQTSVALSPASTPSGQKGIRSRSPEDYNEDMTLFLFLCSSVPRAHCDHAGAGRAGRRP
ncbi:hypothetical protein ACGFNX_39365 [Streptomyces sp. NPDC048723]|uniref:hypothetical protein n=1 Tax=Streptomyces sp. NPDC048723 TaxID=3365589 RepID=UPI003712EAB4